MWCEVLETNLRDLPDDVQHEARHSIDSYVLNLRRQMRHQQDILKQSKGKSTAPPNAQSGAQSSTQIDMNAMPCPPGTPGTPKIPSPQLTPSKNTLLQPLHNALVQQLSYSPSRQLFQSPSDLSPTQILFQQLMSGAPQ